VISVERSCWRRARKLFFRRLTARLAAAKPLFEPGKKSQYSNEGYFLLAAVIERATGESCEEFLRKNIFATLYMENSGTACRGLPQGHNAFGSVATASEARLRPLPFNEAALDGPGSVFADAQDLNRWLRAVDTNPQFGVSKLKYPYGWGKRKYTSRDLIEQSGQLEGFISHVAIYPKEHIYAIVLSNIQSGFSNYIAADLDAVLFGGAVSKPPQVTPVPWRFPFIRTKRLIRGLWRFATANWRCTGATIRSGAKW
jgi:CubicO group peptidase (beta-lactamase class C family)